MKKKRVVITGMSVVSPLGSTVDEFWGNILEGNNGVGPLTKLDAEKFSGNPKSAEVKGAEAIDISELSDIADYGKATEYACKAAKKCLEDAGLPSKMTEPNNYAVIIGTTSGNQDIVERVINTYDVGSEDEELSSDAAEMLSHFRPIELSSKVAEACNFGGSHMIIPTACAAGNYAFGTAYSMIQEGRTSVVLAGGADPFTRSCYTIFYRLGAMTQKDCRPFDKERTGMVVGEGAAMLAIEDYDHAVARGATIYAEISGYALACDAHHVTAPEPNGTGATQAMGDALKSAGISSDQVSYISAHGTGTRANDSHEINAMINIFDDKFENVPVQGLKSMTGHCMGAASALEAVSAVMSIRNQVIPATLNTSNLEEKNGKSPRVLQAPLKNSEVKHVLSNSFAFGGNICSIIFSEPSKN